MGDLFNEKCKTSALIIIGPRDMDTNEDTDKRKTQDKLAREHRCLNRAEFESVTENSRDKSSSLPTRICKCILSI